jgi:hypothetical protein
MALPSRNGFHPLAKVIKVDPEAGLSDGQGFRFEPHHRLASDHIQTSHKERIKEESSHFVRLEMKDEVAV